MSETKSPVSFYTAGAITQKALVKLSGSTGEVVVNTAATTDKTIGVADYAAADNSYVSITLLPGNGTIEMMASGVIARGADVYAAAAGKISALPSAGGAYKKIGVAQEAATADGDIIEVIPVDFGAITYVTEEITASGALSVVEGVNSELNSNAGAITGTLADGTRLGQKKVIVMTEASNSSTVSIAHHETSDPEVATFDAVDEYLELTWSGSEWTTTANTCTFV